MTMGPKDRLLEALALPLLNRTLLAPYGTARELHLDTNHRRAEIVLDLNGENEPLRILVGRYELLRRNGGTFVALHDIVTSREWLTALAQHSIAGVAVEVPPELAGVLVRWI